MSRAENDFKELGAKSAPYEELSDIRQRYAELKRGYRRICIYALDLFCQNRSKDQEIDALYLRMYGLAELPKRKKDRNKIYRALQMTKSRPQNRQDVAFPATEFWGDLHTDMLPARNVSRPRARYRGEVDPFSYDGGRYNDLLSFMLLDDQGWGDDRD